MYYRVFLLLLALSAFSESVLCSAGETKAFQILAPDSQHQHLVPVESGLQRLSSLGQEQPLTVIGMVGTYHTGKSFLLNALVSQWLADEDVGHGPYHNYFPVAQQVDPKTMGVWMLVTGRTLPDGSRLAFLDTEGFSGQNVTEHYDAQVFSAAVWLSNVLVYNSVKLIDQAAVESLEILARRAQLFQIKNSFNLDTGGGYEDNQCWDGGDGGDGGGSGDGACLLRRSFPNLVWVVKDFAQNLEGMSPSEWLNQYIDGRHRDEQAPAEISLRDVFPEIDCLTMFLPAVEEDQLSDLGGTVDSLDELTNDYLQALVGLKSVLMTSVVRDGADDGAGDNMANGGQVAVLTQFLADQLKMDRLPRVPSLWRHWVQDLVAEADKDMQSFFEDQMRRRMAGSGSGSGGRPMNGSRFQQLDRQIEMGCLRLYRSILFNLENLYQPGEQRLILAMEQSRQLELFPMQQELVQDYLGEQTRQWLNEIHQEMGVWHDQLPIDPQSTEDRTNNYMFSWTRRYSERMVDYLEEECNSAVQEEFLGHLDRRISAYRQRNRDLIADTLRKTLDQTLTQYRLYLEEGPSPRPLTGEQMEKFLNRMSEQARSRLETGSGDHWSWGQYLGLDTGINAHFEQETAKLGEQFRNANMNALQLLLHLKTDEWRTELLREHQGWHLPMFEKQLEGKIRSGIDRVRSAYEAEFGTYREFAVYGEMEQAFQSKLEELAQMTRIRNLDILMADAHYALQCLEERLDVAEQNGFSLANQWTWAYRRQVLTIGLDCFSSDSRASQYPRALAEKAITRWLEVHHRKELDQVKMRSFMWLIFLAGAGAILLMIMSGPVKTEAYTKNLDSRGRDHRFLGSPDGTTTVGTGLGGRGANILLSPRRTSRKVI